MTPPRPVPAPGGRDVVVRVEARGWRERYDRLDAAITGALAISGPAVLRLGLGLVFLWFGVLKFFPGLSPAQDLASRTIELLTFGTVPPDVALPALAAWETLIGLGLLWGRFLRATLLLLAVQMVGTAMPLILFPGETFSRFPFAPTLEGQYIIKNVVLLGGAMVVGAMVRGGRLGPDWPTADGTTRAGTMQPRPGRRRGQW